MFHVEKEREGDEKQNYCRVRNAPKQTAEEPTHPR